MTIPLLTVNGDPPSIDTDKLIASRMLIQANSGGGKSYAIRYLLEQTHGLMQHLVLDPEGEFFTLREKYPYVLAGKDRDIPVDPKNAKLMCRRFMELGTSAVIDLYELVPSERRSFVRQFLEELMHLPRTLWHPTLVILDEAHAFAPEKGHGDAESLNAVISLATLGRKRGYALVAATQRLSKFHKDVAAEMLNKMIGRTSLDVDAKRAAEELGMEKSERMGLRALKAGSFYVYGPAISDEVTLVRTGFIKTKHPKVGGKTAPTPPPPATLKKLLAQLQDIPQEAQDELRSLEDFKRKNRELEHALAAMRRASETTYGKLQPAADVKAQARALAQQQKQFDAQMTEWNKRRNAREHELAKIEQQLRRASAVLHECLQRLFEHVQASATVELWPQAKPVEKLSEGTRARLDHVQGHARVVNASVERESNGKLERGELAVLTAIAQAGTGADRTEISILTGYKQTTRDAYIRRLRAAGLIEQDGNGLVATDAAFVALGSDYKPLPTGYLLYEYWMNRLERGEAAVLKAIANVYPNAISRNEITDITEYKQTTRDAYIRRLKARKLITSEGSDVKASALLFDGQ